MAKDTKDIEADKYLADLAAGKNLSVSDSVAINRQLDYLIQEEVEAVNDYGRKSGIPKVGRENLLEGEGHNDRQALREEIKAANKKFADTTLAPLSDISKIEPKLIEKLGELGKKFNIDVSAEIKAANEAVKGGHVVSGLKKIVAINDKMEDKIGKGQSKALENDLMAAMQPLFKPLSEFERARKEYKSAISNMNSEIVHDLGAQAIEQNPANKAKFDHIAEMNSKDFDKALKGHEIDKVLEGLQKSLLKAASTPPQQPNPAHDAKPAVTR